MGLGVLLCGSCGTPDPKPLPGGISLEGWDVRVGLTAEDGLPGPGRLTGEGFQDLGANSHVASVANSVVRGTLNDGGNALASGNPESVWVLRGQVLAKPGSARSRSDARVVTISTMDLAVTRKLAETRVMVESILTPTIGGNSFALYEIEAELSFEGTELGRIRAEYALYPGAEAGMVEIYRGRRGTRGSRRVAVVRNGTAYTVEDPSFYFDLTPGAHELVFTIKLSAGSPQHPGLEGRSGAAGIDVTGRLRVESKSPDAGGSASSFGARPGEDGERLF